MPKIALIERIREPADNDTIRERVSYALEGNYIVEEIDFSKYIFGLPYPEVDFYKQEYYPDSQLNEICLDLPINHRISRELASQANNLLKSVIGIPSAEVAKVYGKGQARILKIVAGRCGFEPVFENVRKFAHQIVNDPVIVRGSSESMITMDSVSSLSGYSAKHREDFLHLIMEARKKSIHPAFLINVLSKEKRPDTIDFFVECFSKLDDGLDSRGDGEFTANGLRHIINFPFAMEYLITNFGMAEVKKKFDQQKPSLRNGLNAIFDFYHREDR